MSLPGDVDQRGEGCDERPGRPDAGHQVCQRQEHAAPCHAPAERRRKGSNKSHYNILGQ